MFCCSLVNFSCTEPPSEYHDWLAGSQLAAMDSPGLANHPVVCRGPSVGPAGGCHDEDKPARPAGKQIEQVSSQSLPDQRPPLAKGEGSNQILDEAKKMNLDIL